MIEAAMYIALGFFVASLLCLAILPAFYRRAVRLTREAYEAVNPTTYAEVRASQDQALAQHAVDRRRLESALADERHRTAEEKLVSGNLRSELIRTRSQHEQELERIREERKAAELESKSSSDELKRELQKLKESLKHSQDAAKTLEAERDAIQSASSENQESPAPLVLQTPLESDEAKATIASLETQIAALQARLSKYEDATEDLVFADIDPADQSAVIQDLEKQLINIEAKYIAAQSEVTRLIAQSEISCTSTGDAPSPVEVELKEAIEDKARLQALVSDRERALKRARIKLRQYRTDLHNASRLTALRNNLITFAREQLPEADRAKLSSGKPSANTADSAQTDATKTSAVPTSQDGSSAHALVRKIVRASNRQDTAAKAENSNTSMKADPVSAIETEETGEAPGHEPETTKQNKKDVA
ncbi:hypothetical protein [Roseibium sediminis]|uniref:hypothetical protein n=1 Tax=Roseibium sediminis TaxID=1775174 RepID=UPI00123E0F99|nr:hypothetical protein [Roseibium sediminis]